MDEIPNFKILLEKNLSKFKKLKNIHIFEINQKSSVFHNFLKNYFKSGQLNYTRLINNINDDGEKTSINTITKLIELENIQTKFDIIYFNTDFPIYNIIFIMDELFKLLKFNGIFISNNLHFYDYSIKINIDTFIQMKINEITMLSIDSLIIFKKKYIKNFTKKEKEIYNLISNISTNYPSLDISKKNKNSILLDIKYHKISNEKLIKKKSLFNIYNKMHDEYKKLYNKSLLDKIRLKTLDNQVFSRNRPLIREQFNIFFKRFYSNSIDPIRFYHFYKFMELNLKYSKAKKDYLKYELLSQIHLPNKKNINYLHTIHNLSTHSKFKKDIYPYITLNNYKHYSKTQKKQNEFRKIIKKPGFSKKLDLDIYYTIIKNVRGLNSFEQISHMIPDEYINKNNNYNLSKPSKRIAFDLKTTNNLNYVKQKMNKFKIKSFDIIKLEFGPETLAKNKKFPKTNYYTHLLFNNIVFILNNQTISGSCILNVPGIYNETMIDLLQIIRNYFKKTTIQYHKYTMEDKIDISYSIICEDFHGINKNELDEFNNIMNQLYEKNNDLGKTKPIISNFLNNKSYLKNEKKELKNKVINFNEKILENAVLKYKYYFTLYDYFYKNKENENMIYLKKNLLSKQINDYIILLNNLNILEYKKIFQ